MQPLVKFVKALEVVQLMNKHVHFILGVCDNISGTFLHVVDDCQRTKGCLTACVCVCLASVSHDTFAGE